MRNRLHATGLLLFLLPWSFSARVGNETASAERVTTLIGQLEDPESQGRRFELREEDLNLYLQDLLALESPEGIKRVKVGMERALLATELEVDMDEVPMQGGLATGLVQLLLRGRQTLFLKGKLTTRDGTGNFEVTEARLNTISLPLSLVESLLATLGKKQRPPFDPTQPFELPYGIQSLEILSGKAMIQR